MMYSYEKGNNSSVQTWNKFIANKCRKLSDLVSTSNSKGFGFVNVSFQSFLFGSVIKSRDLYQFHPISQESERLKIEFCLRRILSWTLCSAVYKPHIHSKWNYWRKFGHTMPVTVKISLSSDFDVRWHIKPPRLIYMKVYQVQQGSILFKVRIDWSYCVESFTLEFCLVLEEWEVNQ